MILTLKITYMKKIYIKPSIVVETALLNALMDNISVPVRGDINDASNYTVGAKGTVWDDDEDE